MAAVGLPKVRESCNSSLKLVLAVLGIDDPWIWGVYILCILSMLLCVIYGIAYWNKGSEMGAAEARWRKREEEEKQEKERGS